MKKHDPQGCLADMLSDLENVRDFIGESTLEEFRHDEKTRAAVSMALKYASEAFSCVWGKQLEPELTKEIKARYPDVPWRRFQALAGAIRYDNKTLTAEFLWEVFEPGGVAALVEGAMRQELAESRIPSSGRKVSPPRLRRK